MDRCAYCGEELNPNAHFCPNCGRPRAEAPQPEAAPEAPLAEAEYEIEEAEYVIEEAEDATAQPSERVDHVILERKQTAQAPREPQASTQPAHEAVPREEHAAPTDSYAAQPAHKTTGLSIAAFICSLSLVLCGLGAILAIVDLVKGKSEPRKKGLSVAALIISGVVMVMAFIGNTFIKPGMLAPKEVTLNELATAGAQASTKATAKPTAKTTQASEQTQESAQAATGTRIYSGPEEFGMETVLTNPNWTYSIDSDGILVSPSSTLNPQAARILIASVRLADLSSAERDADKVLSDFMGGVTNSTVNVQSMKFRNGYEGSYASGRMSETNDPVTAVAWQAGERLYLMALINPGNANTGEMVFNGLVNNFKAVSSDSSVNGGQNKPLTTPKPAVASGRRIISLVAGFGFIAGLREDGTVAVSTLNYLKEFKQEVAQWTDIVSIDVQRGGDDYLLGLKKNGTVVVAVPDKAWPADYIDSIRPQIAEWTDIVSIEAGWHTIFGVRRNGTVVGVCFYSKPDDDWGDARRLKESAAWKDIQAVTESSSDLYGLKKDGTWVCCSTYRYDDISKYENVVAVIEDGYYLLANGTVSCIYSKPNSDFLNWTGIQKIIMSGFGVIGIKNDGTVEIVNRENESIQNVVSGWTDIVDIAAFPTHNAVFGVKSDGTVIAAGKYSDYMNTEWWK